MKRHCLFDLVKLLIILTILAWTTASGSTKELLSMKKAWAEENIEYIDYSWTYEDGNLVNMDVPLSSVVDRSIPVPNSARFKYDAYAGTTNIIFNNQTYTPTQFQTELTNRWRENYIQQPLAVSIEGRDFEIQRLMPGQNVAEASSPVVAVIFEEEVWKDSSGRLKVSPGHVGIRVNNTIYEIEKTFRGSGIYKTRNYQDVLNDSRGQIEVRFNFMVPDQIKQLEDNLEHYIESGEQFYYDLFNNECANMVENEFNRVGVYFPNDFFELPRGTINQARELNQTTQAPMTDWRQHSYPLSSSYDSMATLQSVTDFNQKGLISKLYEVPAVKNYLDTVANSTNTNIIDSCFQEMSSMMELYRTENIPTSPPIDMSRFSKPLYEIPIPAAQPITQYQRPSYLSKPGFYSPPNFDHFNQRN